MENKNEFFKKIYANKLKISQKTITIQDICIGESNTGKMIYRI